MTETLAPTRAFSGSALKKLRQQAAISQLLLGQKVGVSHRAISFWEDGTNEPKVRFLPALADALGCKIDDLFE